MITPANTPLSGNQDMALSDRLSSPHFAFLPTSPYMGSTPESAIPMKSPIRPADERCGASVCTPHPGLTHEVPVVEAVACRKRAVRRTRRFGGRQSESPNARRRLVFNLVLDDLEREE